MDDEKKTCGCGQDLELIPEYWPWHEEYWICPDCDSTYCHEKNWLGIPYETDG
jgi:hypothetical protein